MPDGLKPVSFAASVTTGSLLTFDGGMGDAL